MRPIRKHEIALRARYELDLTSYLNDKAAYEAARSEAIKKGGGNRATIKTNLTQSHRSRSNLSIPC